MSFIVLHRPVASDPKLERVHMFPGRHLGMLAIASSENGVPSSVVRLVGRGIA